MFERLQNDVLFNISEEEYEELYKEFGFKYSPDEKYMRIIDIINQGGSFINFILEKENSNDLTIQEKCDFIKRIIAKDEDNILCLPFYSLKENKVIYLPYDLYCNYYGSNGMAAGNTSYEAIVQGMSEIFERVAQKRIHLECPCLPEISLESLREYPYIYDRMQKLINTEGYKYKLIDCSFGGEYPVVGLIVIEKNTGKYGLKLGCHPDYVIAIERTITEASQGHSIFKYSNRSILDFLNREVENPTKITNGFKYGHAQFPYQLFGSKSNYSSYKIGSNKNNKQYFFEWKNKLLNEGYDILIRDVSFLDFPAYHLIIPGLSEVVKQDEESIKAHNTRKYVKDLLNNIESVNKNNCKYIISVLNYFADDIFNNRLFYYITGIDSKKLPFIEYNCESIYLVALCYIMLEDYKRAYEHICLMENIILLNSTNEESNSLLLGIKLYLEGMTIINNHKEVITYLNEFFDKEICDRIDYLFAEPKDILKKQYSFEKKLEIDENMNMIIRNIYKVKQKNIIEQEANSKLYEE